MKENLKMTQSMGKVRSGSRTEKYFKEISSLIQLKAKVHSTPAKERQFGVHGLTIC